MTDLRVVSFPGWVAAVNAADIVVLEPAHGITWTTLRDGRKIATTVSLREALLIWTGSRLDSSEREAAIEVQAQKQLGQISPSCSYAWGVTQRFHSC